MIVFINHLFNTTELSKELKIIPLSELLYGFQIFDYFILFLSYLLIA